MFLFSHLTYFVHLLNLGNCQDLNTVSVRIKQNR